MLLLLAALASLVQDAVPSRAPDYGDLYARGVTYAAFVEQVRVREAEWRRNTESAAVPEELARRVAALPADRRLLVVAVASCSDSVSTIPYLAKLAAASGGHVDIRIVDGDAGRAVMEAHRTPDGRAATPTIAVLDAGGRLVGAWSERPSALQTWYLEQKPHLSSRELASQKAAWYARDAGRSTIEEVVRLLER